MIPLGWTTLGTFEANYIDKFFQGFPNVFIKWDRTSSKGITAWEFAEKSPENHRKTVVDQIYLFYTLYYILYNYTILYTIK